MNVLVTGATGQLGPYVVRALAARGHELTLWAATYRGELFGCGVRHVDLTDRDALAAAFAEAAPEAVVHCAAMSSIAGAHAKPARCEAINVAATAQLAGMAAALDAPLVYISTDLVFDGEHAPYSEEDAPNPLSVYGRTKLAGEAPVLASPRGLVLRLPLLVGPSLTGRPRFFDHLIAALRASRPISLFDDEWRTPLATDVAAGAITTALDADATGLFHLAGPDRLSRFDMGRIIADVLGADASVIQRASRLSRTAPEPRPADTSLRCQRWYGAFPDFRCETFEQAVRRLSCSPPS